MLNNPQEEDFYPDDNLDEDEEEQDEEYEPDIPDDDYEAEIAHEEQRWAEWCYGP